jgi:choline dehydrogenase
VVARRLAENREVSVLLLEAGGSDEVSAVMEAGKWPMSLGNERDWSFAAQPNLHLHGRSIHLAMGKVLGGGSSMNGMAWARGHQRDWEFFASEAGNPAWNYESVLNIYRRIEDWHGGPAPQYRGTGGPVFVEPAPNPNPIAPAMLEGARSMGIPTSGTTAHALNHTLETTWKQKRHHCEPPSSSLNRRYQSSPSAST